MQGAHSGESAHFGTPTAIAAPNPAAQQHDFGVNVLRTLAELLGDVHDYDARRDLRRRIDERLGHDPEHPDHPPATE